MHNISAFFAVATLLTATTIAHAQGLTPLTRPISIGISGGVALPSGELSNGRSSGFTGTNTGYDITGSVGFALPVVPFGLRVDASYNKFGTKGLSFLELAPLGTAVVSPLGPIPSGYNADVRVMAFTANVVYPVPLVAAVIRPYLIAGAGIYNVVQEPFIGDSYSQTNAGYDLGAGATLPLGAFHAFVEARYHRVNQHSGSNAFIPVTMGVMF
ncbi:MAG TPA: outer membrane beta-barrel protein [Gemmatimonadaceae bacterium]